MNENTSGMNPVAKMGFVPRGIYNNETMYDFLDFVYYNGNTYVAKKLTAGNEPQENNEYWQIFARGGIEDVGIQFQEAAERQNIQSGEDVTVLFGKIKKWYTGLKTVAFSGKFNDLLEKPTAHDVGALPLRGGEMEGNINFESLEGDYKITGAKEIALKYEGQFDANAGYINGVQELSFGDGSFPIRNNAVLTTEEQIDANTDTNNVASATALKGIKSRLDNSIAQINSNLADKAIVKSGYFAGISGDVGVITLSPFFNYLYLAYKYVYLIQAYSRTAEIIPIIAAPEDFFTLSTNGLSLNITKITSHSFYASVFNMGSNQHNFLSR